MKTIAFVPVRGGSKSIKNKNIKLLGGKPLVYWCLESLQNSKEVNEVYVATDDLNIKDVVESFKFNKIKVVDRSEENSTDTASTESVMLEFLANNKFEDSDLFMLVQATSPFTTSEDFDSALTEHKRNTAYPSFHWSTISAVRVKRFFWNDGGYPVNYLPDSRPRRQEFKGYLMENGAFYIGSVGTVQKYKNRIPKNAARIYEMPEYTGLELDEPEDWVAAEALIGKRRRSNHPEIKLFFTDIDGTLTDGGMYYSNRGEECKKFNTKDGLAINSLQAMGTKVGVITGETSSINSERLVSKLGVDYFFQGANANRKLDILKQVCKEEDISLGEVAYIGDDVGDVMCLLNCGVAACPCNASERVKKLPGIVVLENRGGEGAVREFVEYLLGREL